jgi:Phage tail protein
VLLDLIATLDIDGLELVDSDDYWCTLIDGLLEPSRRVPTADNPGSDGGFIGNPLYGMRPVSVGVAIKRTAPMPEALSALTGVCRLKRDALGVKQLKTIHFTTTDGREFELLGEVTRLSPPALGEGNIEFLISILAEDPLLYDPDEQESAAIVRATGGGLIIPFVSPAVSAASSGGSGIASNDGASEAPVILELVGPLTSPYVLNQAVGQSMQLDYTIPAGMTVLVDSHDNTILIDGGGSLIDKKAPGSHFFSLAPGPNNIIFSTGDSSDTGHLKLRWRNASISL